MTTNLTFSLPEICLFLASAIVIGVTIRHFSVNRRKSKEIPQKESIAGDESNPPAVYDAEIAALQDQLRVSAEKVNTLTLESEELRWRHRSFEALKEDLEKRIAELNKKNNLHQLTITEKTRIVANG